MKSGRSHREFAIATCDLHCPGEARPQGGRRPSEPLASLDDRNRAAVAAFWRVDQLSHQPTSRFTYVLMGGVDRNTGSSIGSMALLPATSDREKISFHQIDKEAML
jgi:hypothetical protein